LFLFLDEIVDEMNSIKLDETLLVDICKLYRDNYEISELCSFVTKRIESKKSKIRN